MFLSDLLVVFAVTAVVVFLFGRAQIPSVIGLLVSGLVVGPYGLSLVDDLESVELLAEIGVVVLLFTVGLEISISRLLAMLPLMVRIGLPQIVGTTLLIAAACRWYVGTLPQAIFAGLLDCHVKYRNSPQTFSGSKPIWYSGRTYLDISTFISGFICNRCNAGSAFVGCFS